MAVETRMLFGNAPDSAYQAHGGKVTHNKRYLLPMNSGKWIKYPNGWIVSIQWGAGTYSSYHFASFDLLAAPSHTAEVACWKNNGPMVQFSNGDTVMGYRSWDQVQELLEAASDPIWNGPVGLWQEDE